MNKSSLFVALVFYGLLCGLLRCGCWVFGKNTLVAKDVKTLIENNGGLKSTLGTMLDQFATPSLRSKVFAIAMLLLEEHLL